MSERLAITLATALLLTACGSRPIHQPAASVNAQNDMALGMRAYTDNDYLEARNFFGRALASYRSVDAREGQMNALIDLADSALGQGEYAAARRYLEDANQIGQSGDFPALMPHIALLSAYADMQAGDNQPAATRLDTLLNNPATPADVYQAALCARAQTAFDLKSADAAEWLDKLSTNLGKHPDALSNARYQRLEALAARDSGDMQKAASLYTGALNAYRAAYYRPGIAASLEEWAGLSMQQKDWRSARDQLQRALNVRLSMYDRKHSLNDLEKLQTADTALDDSASAKQAAQLADYLKNGGDPMRRPDQHTLL